MPALAVSAPDMPPVERPAEELLFVFAAIGDSHVKRYMFDDYRYLKAISISRELLANYVEDINDHVPPVDFAVHLGDVTDFGEVAEFNHAKNVLDGLRCPLYPVVGNHDNFRSDNKAAWKEFAGRDSTNYTFDHGGFHFIVIDCTPNPYDPADIECGSALRAWVADYPSRDGDLGLAGHQALFDAFHGERLEVRDPRTLDVHVARLAAHTRRT